LTVFSRTIFQKDFREALEQELGRRQMTVRELSTRSGVPAATIYKISSGDRDPQFSTVKALVAALEPFEQNVIAVIGAKFLVDTLGASMQAPGGTSFRVRGYAANTFEDCIAAAVRAEKEGAGGIICAPIIAALIERIVDIPVVIIKPDSVAYHEAVEALLAKLG
jgi:predicted transcriptional regulator